MSQSVGVKVTRRHARRAGMGRLHARSEKDLFV